MQDGSFNSDDNDRPRWGQATVLERKHKYSNADQSPAYEFWVGRNPDKRKAVVLKHLNPLPFGDRLESEEKPDYLPGRPANQPWVLYRLPELLAAPLDQLVFVVEGEKDADTLAAWGLIATTNPNGANKWLPEFAQPFAGRTAVLIPDSDARGHQHIRKVLGSLHGVAAAVRMIDLEAVEGENKDITEWAEAGGTRAELLELVARASLVTPDTLLGKDAIVLKAGKSPEIVDQLESLLLACPKPVFQRGADIVRLAREAEAPSEEGIRRDQGALVVKQATARWLQHECERHGTFMRARLRKQAGNAEGEKFDHVVVDLPIRYPETLAARGEWSFPPLRAVLTGPTLRSNGDPLEQPGYDRQTGLWLDFDPAQFPEVPRSPTHADAVAALRLFNPLFDGFPFESEAAKAVALSAVLTAAIRASLKSAPLIVFDAPVAGTGKSKLATAAAVLATGRKPAMMSQGKTEEESEKRLSTAMMEGDQVIVFDNCEQPVGGDFLCSALTEATVQARILGKSERRTLPTAALLMVTGNNIVIQGDMVRRSVICRLDARDARPDLRSFSFDPIDEIGKRRPELLVAALTALRAFKLAKPELNLSRMGSFEDWDWVRGTLVWCGYADPVETREALFDAEPQEAELAEIHQLWQRLVGGRTLTTAEIGTATYGAPLWPLHQALIAVTGRPIWNPKSVGRWLQRQKGKVIDGRAFQVVSPGKSRTKQFALEGGAQAEEPAM